MRFDNAIALATRLIAKNGQKVTWKQVKATSDVSEPWKQSATVNVNKTVSICFVPAKDNEWRKLLAYLKGTEVPMGRLAGLMAPVNFEIGLQDIVVRSGVDLRIVNIDTLQPNEQKVLHIVEFEG